MYAQNSILCQFGNLEICPNFANPYLTQFSSISGGNCINEPQGYQKIRVHLIFAVKYDDRQKTRLEADGHLTPDPVGSIYSGVVSLRNLRLVMFLDKLSNLELWGADIGNDYLEAVTEQNYLMLRNLN